MYLLLTLVPSNHEGMVLAEEEEGRKGDDSTCTLNLLFPFTHTPVSGSKE